MRWDYLGYRTAVNHCLKYLASSDEDTLDCIEFADGSCFFLRNHILVFMLYQQ